ncbi:MAG TPA: hypothetical protein VFZ08_13600, partial [Terriglobia bacterium]|nr:hypothetical protein [Terriglobia bacterium]
MTRKRFVVLLAIAIGLIGNFGLFGQTAKSVFEVTRTGVVYGSPSYQPGIVRTRDGSLLVSFMSGDHIYTTKSSDNGLTWQKPTLVADGA